MTYKTHQSYLHIRGSAYYFRIAVPKKLLPIFGRKEYKKSLRTGDYTQAKHLCAKYGLFAEGYFKLVTRMKSGNEDITALLRAHFEKCLMDAEDTLWTMRQEFKEEIAEENIDEVIQSNKERYKSLVALARTKEYDIEQVQIAKQLLEWKGLTLSKGSDAFRELAKGITEAQLETQRMKIAYLEKDNTALEITAPLFKDCKNYLLEPDFELRKTYRHKPYHGEVAKVITLGTSITEYLQSKERESAEWRRNHKGFLNRLIEILGADCRLYSLEKADGAKIEEKLWTLQRKTKEGNKDTLEKLHPNTVKTHWSAFKSFFSWCSEREYIKKNILAEIKLKLPKSGNIESGFRPYTIEELNSLFHSPLYTGHKHENSMLWEKGSKLEKNGNYWIPLVGLFSGLRLGEILYLQINDIRKDGEVFYIDVNTDEEGKRLKNLQSARKIPIHSELMKIGFLKYWEKRSKITKPTDKLFDGITFPKNQKVIKNFSRNYSKLITKLEIKKDKSLAFHSFRGNYVDAMNRVPGIPPEVKDPLDGRSIVTKERGSRVNYGTEFSPTELSPWVEKMDFKVDLSHLHSQN